MLVFTEVVRCGFNVSAYARIYRIGFLAGPSHLI